MQSESKRDDDRRTLSKGKRAPFSLPSEPSACSKRLVGRQTSRYVWLGIPPKSLKKEEDQKTKHHNKRYITTSTPTKQKPGH